MTELIQQKINDKAWARWTVLVLIASMMFFAYMFVDVLSPLKSLIEHEQGWSSSNFGTYAAGEYILNVFGFLIIAGIILDKMGTRFTGVLSASLMVIGACIKLYAVSDWFIGTEFESWLNSWWVELPGSAKLAAFGFMIFGCGCEMAGTTVSKALARWFEGKEMALAMGLEMAIARLGVFAVMWISPLLAEQGESATVVRPIAFCTALLLIGLITFSVFTFMDKKLDKDELALGKKNAEVASDEEFKMSDLGKIFSSKMFWLVALLCVLYYSAIFPFQRYAPNFLEETLKVDIATASGLFSFFPILAMCLTPFLGAYLDKKGNGATMLMIGALIMVLCHACFAFLLPLVPSKTLAVTLIAVLGVSFSLVPAALWPSVPKIIEPKILGSAYCLIFWVQNIGLCLVPVLIGFVLEKTGGYQMPMIIFASFGVLAFFFSLLLKVEDKRSGYGLEEPNIK